VLRLVPHRRHPGALIEGVVGLVPELRTALCVMSFAPPAELPRSGSGRSCRLRPRGQGAAGRC